MKTLSLSELQAEKCRIARLLTKAIESHQEFAIRANANKIRSLNRQILQLEQSNHQTSHAHDIGS
jgi:hypothetical protein